MVSGVDRDGAALPGQLLHHPAGQGIQSWQKVQLCVIIKLGQAHRLTQDIVLGHRVWNKLMERECLFKQRGRDFVQNRIQVLDIVQLLKSMEDPLPHLRDLLGQICKRFPPTDPSLGKGGYTKTDEFLEKFQTGGGGSFPIQKCSKVDPKMR